VTLGQLLLTALITSSTFGLFIQVSHNNGFLPVRAPARFNPTPGLCKPLSGICME